MPNREGGCTRIQPTNQPYVLVNKANGGQIDQIIRDVSTIFNIYKLECNKNFEAGVKIDAGSA